MITGEGAHGVCVVRAQIQLTQGGRRCAHSSTTVPPFGTPTSTICNHLLTNNQIQKLEDDQLTKCYWGFYWACKIFLFQTPSGALYVLMCLATLEKHTTHFQTNKTIYCGWSSEKMWTQYNVARSFANVWRLLGVHDGVHPCPKCGNAISIYMNNNKKTHSIKDGKVEGAMLPFILVFPARKSHNNSTFLKFLLYPFTARSQDV